MTPIGRSCASSRRTVDCRATSYPEVVEIHKLSGDQCSMLKVRATSIVHLEGSRAVGQTRRDADFSRAIDAICRSASRSAGRRLRATVRVYRLESDASWRARPPAGLRKPEARAT